MKKPRKLAHEILGLIAISALLAALVFLILSGVAGAVVEEYVFNHDISMTEFDWMELDRLVFGGSVIAAVCFFSILFLALLADRMAYIRKITEGIHALRKEQAQPVPEEGNNELTELAAAINFLSAHQKQVKEKEQVLQAEKEALIRSLSHDIRTPLTSILTYSEYLADQETGLSPEGREQLALIRRKGEQIRDLTDILLDGGKRNLEHFDDARLLFAQLAEEFSGELENDFDLQINVTACPSFSGNFDVQELRRLFDNLSSNIRKYADPAWPVTLSAMVMDGRLLIRQENTVGSGALPAESLGIGLQSIRRIAQNYGGSVETDTEKGRFFITITLFL